MFNRQYNNTVVSSHVNAVIGNITKTYAKSFFKRFHLKSSLAENLLNSDPEMRVKLPGRSYESTVSVVVIQMVICGDMEVMAEIMTKSDYEEMLGLNP